MVEIGKFEHVEIHYGEWRRVDAHMVNMAALIPIRQSPVTMFTLYIQYQSAVH